MDRVVDGHKLRNHPGVALGHRADVVGEQEHGRVVVHVQERDGPASEHDEGSITEFPEL